MEDWTDSETWSSLSNKLSSRSESCSTPKADSFLVVVAREEEEEEEEEEGESAVTALVYW